MINGELKVAFLFPFVCISDTPSNGKVRGYKQATDGFDAKEEWFVPPFLYLNHQTRCYWGEESEAKVRLFNQERAAKLQNLVRWSESGAGMFRIDLTFTETRHWRAEEILAVTNLGLPRNVSCELIGASLYEMMTEFVSELRRTSQGIWLDAPPKMYAGGNDDLEWPKEPLVTNPYTARPVQYPYPVTMLRSRYLKLDEPRAVLAALKVLKRLTDTPDIAGLVEDGLFIRESQRLVNLNGNREVFFNFSFKGALCWVSNTMVLPKSNNIACYYLESMELLRSRWFVLGLLNSWLDRMGMALEGQLKLELSLPTERRALSRAQKYARVALKRRATMSRLLHGPVLYHIGTASAHEIERRGQQVFGLDGLLQLCLAKRGLVDKMFENVVDVILTEGEETSGGL